MINKININIKKQYQGLSIKQFLKSFHVGRGKIEELRVNKSIFVNNEIKTLDYILKTDELLTFISEEKSVIPKEGKVEIVYEDDNVIACYKERGYLVHDDGNNQITLMNLVANYLLTNNKVPILYPLHRIDKDTCGIVIFAKNFLACSMFSYMIENKEIIKEYLFLVHGRIDKNRGTLKYFIASDRHSANKVRISTSGQMAITSYEVLKRSKDYTKLIARIYTGRKHQIRVSFSYINHPLVGDKLYYNGVDKLPLQLESYRISYLDPFTNNKIIIKTKDNILMI